MGKSTFFTGQPVMAQLLQLIPASLVAQTAKRFQSNHYYKKFKAYDHLVSMLFCGFNQCTSLRELITGLQANSNRLKHLGLNYTPRRTTLADANKCRSSEFFEGIFHGLVKHHFGGSPDSLKIKAVRDRLFVIDSTTISLFCEVMKAAGYYRNGKKKGGIKAHTLMRVKDQVPSFVHLSESAMNDRVFLPMINLPANSIVAMDKGYVNYHVMKRWTENNITWVSRLNEAANFELIETRSVTDYHQKHGITFDQLIILGNKKTTSRRPIQIARLVGFYDMNKKRSFTFITNNLKLSALTVAKIYKQRWSIESLFRRVKQNFQFHNFLGDNENAIKIQVWCTLIADLLVAIVKETVERLRKSKWSFANIAGLIRLHLTTYIDLFKFLHDPEKAIITYSKEIQSPQLLIFDS